MIEDEGVEIPIVFKAHTRSQRITLRRNFIDPPTIIYPARISEASALKEIRVHPAYAKLKAQMQESVKNSIQDGYRTRLHVFRFHMNRAGETYAAYERGEVIDVYLPDDVAVDSHTVQRFLFKTLKAVVRIEADRILPTLVSQRAVELGLKFQSVAVKPLVNAWGKCRSDGYLVFSPPLLFYPDRFVSHVVDHELTHLTYLDHSAAFWDLLSKYRGVDARQEDQAMNRYVLRLPTVY